MGTRIIVEDTFWITNITNRIVSIDDLGVYVQPMSSINLLDKKHYSFKREDLLKSAESGTLFTKRSRVVVRKVPPPGHKPTIIAIQHDAVLPSKPRSGIGVERVVYDELKISDDEYAADSIVTDGITTEDVKK